MAKEIYKRKTKGRVNNTCGNSSLMKRMTRRLAGLEKHLAEHPKCSATATAISNTKQRMAWA